MNAVLRPAPWEKEHAHPLSQMPAGGSSSVLAMIGSVSVGLSLRDS